FIIAGAVVFGVLTALSLALAVNGTKKLRFLNRYQTYIRMFRQRWNVPIRELADRVGKSVEFTVRDLQKMIDRRLFYQAHIDRDQNYFILSDEAYQAYRLAQEDYAAQARRQADEQERQKRREQETEKADAELPPECRELIQKGKDYIDYIHVANERIPGEEISAKLDRMERVVTRIFDVVRAHPEVAPELNKLMSYYLPTTKKLLDAYQELDSQPVAGNNISSTKIEVDKTIDTLNVAYEKLLDSLFENRAWDISSDISVLHTILAQDGLKEDELHAQG
ncbi:MAG: 5-bromo-4-chloroindolyl phosphate hydrolysis family protein, partial [Clostridiales bacterium]|nr:5-bromo-4-chloroindolyl phosphate hydrolysis family protein [Clostridiales bacterium]